MPADLLDGLVEEVVPVVVPESSGPVVASTGVQVSEPKALAKKLRAETAAVRLRRGKWGTTKKLDRGQVQKAADSFQADAKYLGASKKLINRRDVKYSAACAVIREAVEYWTLTTIPYPEPGIRLIRKERLADFNAKMEQFKTELAAAAADLDASYDEIIAAAKEHLGELFREDDYPVGGVAGLFKLEWDFPSVEPAGYLLQMSPALYEQEQARIQARFEEAVRLTEESFAEKFAELVTNLAERLEVGEDGKPKVFRDSAVENLKGFFEQFRALNIGSNPDLDALVTQAQELVGGADPKELRTDVTKRAEVKTAMASLAVKLDAMLVNKPSRTFDFDSDE
jgi:hypothetical protein